MSTLRFHWEFFGPDATRTAKHFCKHLNEFCEREGVEPKQVWTKEIDARCDATLECAQEHLVLVRDRLKPKRAERVG